MSYSLDLCCLGGEGEGEGGGRLDRLGICSATCTIGVVWYPIFRIPKAHCSSTLS